MSSPVDQIRAHLQSTGRPGRTTAEKLVAQWDLDGSQAADREQVAQELAAAGLRTEPVLTAVTDPGAPLVVALLDEVAADRLVRAQQAAGWTKPIPRPQRETQAREQQTDAPAHDPAFPADARNDDPGRRDAGLLIAGAFLIVVALFLPWYSGAVGGQGVDDLSSGWQWLEILDIGLVALAVAAVGLAAVREPTAARAVLVGGAVALFCVTVRIVSPPSGPNEGFAVDTSLSVGPFVAAVGAAAVVIAAGTLSGLLAPRSASPASQGDRT